VVDVDKSLATHRYLRPATIYKSEE
jgi:hypothetical protein